MVSSAEKVLSWGNRGSSFQFILTMYALAYSDVLTFFTMILHDAYNVIERRAQTEWRRERGPELFVRRERHGNGAENFFSGNSNSETCRGPFCVASLLCVKRNLLSV